MNGIVREALAKKLPDLVQRLPDIQVKKPMRLRDYGGFAVFVDERGYFTGHRIIDKTSGSYEPSSAAFSSSMYELERKLDKIVSVKLGQIGLHFDGYGQFSPATVIKATDEYRVHVRYMYRDKMKYEDVPPKTLLKDTKRNRAILKKIHQIDQETAYLNRRRRQLSDDLQSWTMEELVGKKQGRRVVEA